MPVTVDWIEDRKKKSDPNIRSNNTTVENDLLDQAQERFKVARERKVDYENQDLGTKWDKLEKVVRGDQWVQDVPDYMSTPVINVLFALIEAAVSRLTDVNPEVLVTPRRDPEANQDLATMLTQTQGYLWFVNKMKRRCREAARYALRLGTGIFSAVWDPDMHDGVGDVRYGVTHPKNFFNDPRAYEIDDMEYCFTRVPKSIEYLARRWVQKGALIVPDADTAFDHKEPAADRSSPESTASLHAYWSRDEHGDMTVMYYAGDLVLDIIGGKHDKQRPNTPVYQHNRFPFAKFVDYEADKEFWGVSETELVLMLQRLINDFEAQVIDNTRLMANVQWIVSKVESGLKEEDAWCIGSRPGNVIFTRNGGIEKLEGTPIPIHVTQHIEWLIYMMEQILGIHDVVQGKQPGSVRSASGIIALQESANIRIRNKAANLEEALTEMVDQGNWLVLEHYSEERQVRTGGGIKAPIVTLDIRKALEKRQVEMAAQAGVITGPTDINQMTPETMQMVKETVKFPPFDVAVNLGPAVPYSQALQYEQAKEFYQLGAIDQEALLEAVNFPNKERILARMQGLGPSGERVGEIT